MSDAAPTSAAHDLAYYMAPIRRRRRIVIAFVLLGLILGAAAAILLRPTYTAVASVSVHTDNTNSGQGTPVGGRTGANSGPNMDTEAQNAASRTVAELAAADLDNGTPPGVLLKRLTISVPANTTILRMAFTAHSPGAATDGAKAFANAYLQNRRNNSQTVLDNEIKTTQDELTTANDALTADITRRHQLTPGTAAYATIVTKVANDNAKITQLNQTLTGYQTTTLDPGIIQSEPTASGLAPSPLREIAVATGLVLGLLVGLLGAFTRDRMDPTIRSRTDVELLGVPVTAEIPKPLKGRRNRRSGKADREDATARRKANQRVATGIAAALGAEGGSIYIANLAPNKHADHVADDLARELGRFGSTVEIAGRGEDSIGTSWDPAGYAAGLVHRDHARFTDLDTSLHTRAAVAVVEQALGRSRFVIIDGLGDFEGLDPYVLSSLGQVSVVVVEAGATTREELADAVDQMSMTSCHILGALMWSPPTDANAPSENDGFRRFPPRAIESSVTVEPATEHAGQPAAPTAGGGDTGGLLGWPERGSTQADGAADGVDDADIEDAEVVADDHSDEGGWDPSIWNRAPQ